MGSEALWELVKLFLAALLASLLTHLLSHRRFVQGRWWDRKADAYGNITSALVSVGYVARSGAQLVERVGDVENTLEVVGRSARNLSRFVEASEELGRLAVTSEDLKRFRKTSRNLRRLAETSEHARRLVETSEELRRFVEASEELRRLAETSEDARRFVETSEELRRSLEDLEHGVGLVKIRAEDVRKAMSEIDEAMGHIKRVAIEGDYVISRKVAGALSEFIEGLSREGAERGHSRSELRDFFLIVDRAVESCLQVVRAEAQSDLRVKWWSL